MITPTRCDGPPRSSARRPLRSRQRVRAPPPARAATRHRSRPSLGRRRPAVDREVEALLVPRGRLEAIEVVVSVTSGEVRSWTVHEGMRSGAAVRRVVQRDHRRQGAPRTGRPRCASAASRTSTSCRSTRGRRARSASPTRTAGASAGASRYLRESQDRQRLRPPDRGRPRVLRPGRGRGARGRRPRRRRRCRPSAGSYLPDDVGADAHRPQAARDHPARGPELHASTATWWSGSAGRSASASTPTRGSCSTRSATTTDGDRVRPVLHRASITEMVVPVRAPRRRCTAGRTRSTPASGASAAWRTR